MTKARLGLILRGRREPCELSDGALVCVGATTLQTVFPMYHTVHLSAYSNNFHSSFPPRLGYVPGRNHH